MKKNSQRNKKNQKSDCSTSDTLIAKNFDMKMILIISYLYYMLLN